MDIAVTEELVRTLVRDREREARRLHSIHESSASVGSLRAWLAARLVELGMLVDCAASRRALAGGEGGC